MMDSAEPQNSTITDQKQKSIVSAGHNGHAVTLSAEVLVKGRRSEVSTESSIEGMDDGSSESEHSTSTVNSPSLASTKSLSNHSFSSHPQDTVITSMSATLAASNNNNNFGHTVISPDTTSIIATHQELRATSSSNSHQQLSTLKSGQSSLFSLSTSVNSSKPLSLAGQTVAPPMTMLSSFMGDFKGGQAPVENLSLGGYMELITLQQGGGANSTSGSNFSPLPSSQQPPISSSTLHHISGTSSGLVSTLNPTQTGLSGAMPISINPPLLPTATNPPNYNSPQATNAIFSFQPSPAAIVGGKLQQPSSRSNFSPNLSSAFHQPTTAFAVNLLPGNTMSQHSTAPASSMAPGTKLNLPQPTDFSTGHSALSPQCALPLQNDESTNILCNGGGLGVGSGSGGSGRRATKRTHEESIQQDRNDGTNDQDIGTYSGHMGGKVNAFPTDVGGCGPMAVGVGPRMDGRRGSTSDPLNSQPLQQLKWQAHMVNEWHGLCDGALQDIPKTGFQVETDKGFNFSLVDDSFVCQKKNHFQVTVTIVFHRTPKFLKLKDGSIQPIERFVLDLHGVRFEQVNSCITLEQSKADRTKTKFEPDTIEVPPKPEEPIKRTICRLHFSETTQNNMRKRGKPNPDQKHFSLVVSLNAETKESSYLIVAHVSERIIVRASNPGNFDNDCDYAWLRGTNPEVVYHHGRVGINMDKPEEALSVHGNLHLTGQILQVSDYRVKKNITQLDSRGDQHLENISQLQLYEYQLDKNLCPSVASDSFNYGTNESPDYTNDNRGSCFYDEDPMLRVSMGNEGSKDNLRSVRSEDSPQSHDSWRPKNIGGHTSHHTMKTDEGNELGKAAAGVHVVVRRHVGLLAQEVQRVLPNAVRVTDSTVHLSDGTSVSNLLVVDKDQILMETIGAVQELRHIASGLQQRLSALEEQTHCSYDRSTERQKCITTGTGIRIRNWPLRWHPKHILGLLMIASFLLLFTPLLLA